jgi:predicted nuclease with TOPRIM domain
MNYDNLTNEELLREVYLTQHKDRLLTLVCERLEMVMREAEDYSHERVEGLEEEISDLNSQLADQDDELYELRKRVSDLETQLDAGEY